MVITDIGITVIGFAIAAIGVAFALAITVFGSTSAIARQPEASSRIFTVFIMGAAMAEALGLLGFILALIALVS